MSKSEIFMDRFEITKKITTGGFGEVLLAIDKSKDNSQVVIKRLIQTKDENTNKLGVETFKSEINFLKNFNNDHIVKLLDSFDSPLGPCMVLEYLDGGDLMKIIKGTDTKKFSYIPNDEIMEYFVQICLGLWDIHEKDIVHRDLKPANILVGKDKLVKIADMGIAKETDANAAKQQTLNKNEEITAMIGTRYYQAPETLRSGKVGIFSDIWALGLILHQLCSREDNPYVVPEKCSVNQYLEIIETKKYKQLSVFISPEIKDLVAMLLKVDPDERVTIDEVLDVPVVKRALDKLPKSSANRLAEESIKRTLVGAEYESAESSPLEDFRHIFVSRNKENKLEAQIYDSEMDIWTFNFEDGNLKSSGTHLNYKDVVNCDVCDSTKYYGEFSCGKLTNYRILILGCDCYYVYNRKLVVFDLEKEKVIGELDHDITYPELWCTANNENLVIVTPGDIKTKVVTYTYSDFNQIPNGEFPEFKGVSPAQKVAVKTRDEIEEVQQKPMEIWEKCQENWIAGVTMKYGRIGILWNDGCFTLPWRRNKIYQAQYEGVKKWDAMALLEGNRVVLAGCKKGDEGKDTQVIIKYNKEVTEWKSCTYDVPCLEPEGGKKGKEAEEGKKKGQSCFVKKIVNVSRGFILLVADCFLSLAQHSDGLSIVENFIEGKAIMNLNRTVTCITKVDDSQFLIGTKGRIHSITLKINNF